MQSNHLRGIFVEDNGDRMSCAEGGCPITAGVMAIFRFVARRIPMFRKRAEKTAVNALMDKMKNTVEDKHDVTVEESAKHLR
jgi:hypothetical protein